MIFTKEQRSRLEKAWSIEEELTVYGINSFGVQFVVAGRITTTDSGACGIQDLITEKKEYLGQAIYLEFGRHKDAPTRKQTSYFAPYRTNLELSTIGADLYVLKITDANGNVLYVNQDADKIIKETELAGANKRNELKEKGRYISESEMDAVTRELKKMIGKPIILSYINNEGQEEVDERVVLGAVGGSSNYGSTMLDVLSGPLCGSMHVMRNHILRTESNDGKVSGILAKNDSNDAELERRYRVRVQNIRGK